jgi:hypothetical protein
MRNTSRPILPETSTVGAVVMWEPRTLEIEYLKVKTRREPWQSSIS